MLLSFRLWFDLGLQEWRWKKDWSVNLYCSTIPSFNCEIRNLKPVTGAIVLALDVSSTSMSSDSRDYPLNFISSVIRCERSTLPDPSRSTCIESMIPDVVFLAAAVASRRFNRSYFRTRNRMSFERNQPQWEPSVRTLLSFHEFLANERQVSVVNSFYSFGRRRRSRSVGLGKFLSFFRKVFGGWC